MKKMLMILPYVPWPLRRGTYQRVYHLAEEMGERHEMDLFCFSSEAEDLEHRERFEGFCRRVEMVGFRHDPWPPFWTDRIWNPTPVTVRHWWSETVLAELKRFIEGREYELVWFCDLVLLPYVREVFPDHAGRVMDRSRVDWLFQTEELNTLTLTAMERFKRKENLRKIERLEREAWDELALTIVCGPDDKTFLTGKGGPAERVFVLANGANTGFFNADDWPPKPTAKPSALFCGALDYTPNTDGLEWYFGEIHDRIRATVPDYEIILVGKSPTARIRELAKRDGVRFEGEVPDVRPFYQQAWLQVVPLRIGGGTRLKIAEGLAMANPVVSTTLGAQGLALEDGKDLLLGDSAEDFAKAVVRYLEDDALRRGHGEAGRRTILEQYTWGALGGTLAERLEEISS